MISHVAGKKALVCDVCGRVITSKLDSTLKHGHVCTVCIDKEREVFRVADIEKDTLISLGFNKLELTDKVMEGLADALSAEFLLGRYFEKSFEYLKEKGVSRHDS